MSTDNEAFLNLPSALQDRVHYGRYGGVEQYYISGVDGSLAQLGSKLPSHERLRHLVANADKANEHLLLRHQ